MQNTIYRLCIWYLKKGFGADCPDSDLDTFYSHYIKRGYKMSELVRDESRCSSCKARETIDFLEEVIEINKFSNQ